MAKLLVSDHLNGLIAFSGADYLAELSVAVSGRGLVFSVCAGLARGTSGGHASSEPVSVDEWFHVPSSMAEWEEQRLQQLAANG